MAVSASMPRRFTIPIMSFLIIFVLISIATPIDFRWTISKRSVDSYLRLTGEGLIQRQIALAALGAYSLFIILFKKKRTLETNSLGWLIIVFIILSTLSITWTEDVILSAKRILILVILSLSALAFADHHSSLGLMKFSFFACGITLVLGLAAELVMGTFSPFEPEYRFSGVFHPNEMGQYCTFLIFSSICIYLFSKKKRFLNIGLAGFVFLILTKSRTSFGIMLLSLLCFFPLLSTKSKKRALILLFNLVLIIGCLSIYEKINGTAYILKMISVGRGTDVERNYMGTLVARRNIWKEAQNYIAARPITGYGYGGFWTNRRLNEITINQGWAFGTAHSDYLDIALSLGIVGLFIYCIILIFALKTTINRYKENASIGNCFSLIIVLWFILNSFFSSTGIQPAIPQFLTLTVLAKLSFFRKTAQ